MTRYLRLVLTGLSLLPLLACHSMKAPDRLVLERALFSDLPGWPSDDLAMAIPALLKSCGRIAHAAPDQPLGLEMTAADWREPCAAAETVPSGETTATRGFFERYFVPFRVTNNGDPVGLFTGYYEAELHGARHPDARYHVPLYRRPPDLIGIDLGLFRPSLKGERSAGHIVNGQLIPYPDRHAIDQGALADRGLKLLWVDNPIDAFFLEIQGSGRVILDDGSIVRVGYDGQNGQPYVAIGKLLVDQGVPREQISMAFLRQWIAEHGADGTALMERNPSYVFFRELQGDGPLGAEGVALTPERSAAIDPAWIPYGVPLWIDSSDPASPDGHLQRLMIAQDTGGAIRGPVRADLFFGYGTDAAQHAGGLKGTGSDWVLLPLASAARRGAVL